MSEVLDAPAPAAAPAAPPRPAETAPVDADAKRLEALGYKSHFERKMGLWENFSLGFTYLSPVVGVYSTFAICFAAGGPPMIWSR
jgi:hypothetical protein